MNLTLRDIMAGVLIIGVLALAGQFLPTTVPVDTNTPVVVTPNEPTTPTVDAPVQQAALVVVDDFEDTRTPYNAAVWRSDEWTDKLNAQLPNRWRYWDDKETPVTPEFQALLAAANKVGTYPAYAAGKNGKIESGTFPQYNELQKFDVVLDRLK